MAIELCKGNPCSTALQYSKTEASLTADMALISESGFSLLEDTAEARAFSPNAREHVRTSADMYDKNYEAVSNAREAARGLLGKCATCEGMSGGVCPTVFS